MSSRLEQAWERFAFALVEGHSTPEQRAQVRMVFFAGALALDDLYLEITSGSQVEDGSDIKEPLRDLHMELVCFKAWLLCKGYIIEEQVQ